jgi:hypothetical protein
LNGRRTGKGFDSTAESIAVFTDGGVINYGFHDVSLCLFLDTVSTLTFDSP